jgi:hypothetical protein
MATRYHTPMQSTYRQLTVNLQSVASLLRGSPQPPAGLAVAVAVGEQSGGQYFNYCTVLSKRSTHFKPSWFRAEVIGGN